MNFKKIVSAFSALAISVSAFAGLAVTANAATTSLSLDTKLSSYVAKTLYDFTKNDPNVLPTTDNLRYRKSYGLHNYGTGARSATVNIPVTTGEVIVFELYLQDSDYSLATPTISCGKYSDSLSASIDGTNYYVYEVTSDAKSFTYKVNRANGTRGALVMEKDTSVTTAKYTVNYVDESGNELKTAKEYGGVVGDSVVLTDTDKASFYNSENTKKYIYVSDDSEGKTVANDGTTAVNVTFREAETYNYSVVSNLGDTIASGSAFEADSFKVPYKRYLLKDGVMYSANAINSQYNYSMTLDENNKVGTITYTKDDDISNPVFLVEGEEITGATVYNTGNAAIRSSNSAIGYASQDLTITKLDPGKYNITAVLYTASYATDIPFTIGSNSFTLHGNKGSNWLSQSTGEFTVSEASDVIWKASEGTSKAGGGLDFLYIEKTGDVYGITTTTPDNGTLTVSPTTAAEGDTVTVTATADTGYELNGGITVTPTTEGVEAPVVTGADGTYTFTMPASAVTVTAEFKEKAPTATLTTISESEKVGNIYNVGFLSTISDLANNDGWAIEDAGFTFANISNENINTGYVSVNPEKGALDTGKSFSFIFENISNEYKKFGINAIAYIKLVKDTAEQYIFGKVTDGDNTAFDNANAESTTETETTTTAGTTDGE